MRQPFDDDATPKGIEGFYEVKSDTCVVFVAPTSGKLDWIIDFLALPVPVELVNPRLGWCHAGFKSYAYWLTGVIYKITADHPQVNKVVITGYSMGGGIAQLAALICQAWMDRISFRVISIDGPRTTTILPSSIKLYRNRGSLVADIPPWFKKAKEVIFLNDKWNWFWKSHWISPTEIDKIIKAETWER